MIELDKFINCIKWPNNKEILYLMGESKKVKVVCGATNARKNLLTIYAPPGSIIPKTKMKLIKALYSSLAFNFIHCTNIF